MDIERLLTFGIERSGPRALCRSCCASMWMPSVAGRGGPARALRLVTGPLPDDLGMGALTVLVPE